MADTVTVEIKHRWTDAVLFAAQVPESVASGLRMRAALEQATASGADLRGAYLRDAYLRGANLSDADLSGANLSDADLSGAYLSGAYLSDADLSGAYLRGAYLSDADLSGAYLRGANLSDAYLRGANLSDADLRGADLRDAYLRDAYLRGADAVASPEQSVENLDKVRAIILDNNARLQMNHWHDSDEWRNRTCAEEAMCETTHCLAGWLQVCSTDDRIRSEPDTQLAGIMAAPIASKMFFRGGSEVLSWLEERKYVGEIAERERRATERAAGKSSESPAS